MAVKIGSARSDERGKLSGGKAGDQTGRELSTQDWYRHGKGWVYLFCLVPGMAEHIAYAAEKICASPNVGYDQRQNQSLWQLMQKNGFDLEKIDAPVETDCARLVRVCVQYAWLRMGMDRTVPDFYTATLADKLAATGLFEIRTADKYTRRSDYLERGGILVTCTKGHTVIVLSNGARAEHAGQTVLRRGDRGAAVLALQKQLLALGCGLPKYGADGDFGSETEAALKKLQAKLGLEPDGVFGEATRSALDAVAEGIAAPSAVRVTATVSAWVRSGPGMEYGVITPARRGLVLCCTAVADNGWRCVRINGCTGWISPKMCEAAEWTSIA